jgi:hypothetical protein
VNRLPRCQKTNSRKNWRYCLMPNDQISSLSTNLNVINSGKRCVRNTTCFVPPE